MFIDHGRLTRQETLRGETASRRRAVVRVPDGRAEEARAALEATGFAAEVDAEGSLRLSGSSEADVARAVKTLALADVPVLEVRASADLEGLFREAPPKRDNATGDPS